MTSEPQMPLFGDAGLWRRPERPEEAENRERKARVKPLNRAQMVFRPLHIEGLVGPDHPVRAIWELVGERDLGRFYGQIESVDGVAGRPAHDPRLLISLWIWGYTDGIPSAREIARRCEYDPPYQWLAGANPVCAHTLSDYRTAHADALKDLSAQVLALLAGEGLIDLDSVTQDGTKIRASAGSDTFRRQGTIEKHLEQARQRLAELQGDDDEISRRTMVARQRAAREKVDRMEQALRELETVRQTRSGAEKDKARVSLTDPEARIMNQSDNGFAPSYNVQVTTDAKATVVVSVDVTQDASDARQLQPAVERLQEEAGQAPKHVIADGGYTNRENVVAMAAAEIDLIGPARDGDVQKQALYDKRGVAPEFRPEAFRLNVIDNTYTCPMGKTLHYVCKCTFVGQMKYTYRADPGDCQSCPHRGQCCGTSANGRSIVRTLDGPEMSAFRSKMETLEAKNQYKKRGEVAEFPHLWIKEKFGLRRFTVRGLTKAKVEAQWVCLTYNIQQWIRLCWKVRRLAAA